MGLDGLDMVGAFEPAPEPAWDWSQIAGSPVELKWNRKDLESLRRVIPLAAGRRVAVQAGGCLGVFAKYLAAHFEAVYTFEPSPELFPLLVANAPEPNIVRMQAALGSKPGMVRTECSLRNGKTTLHEGMTRVEPGGAIPTITIDALALPACDLIYLDVEGHELYALQGALKTIRKHRPIIACEVNLGMAYLGITEAELYGLLTAEDYRHVATHRSDRVFAPE